MGFVCEDFAYIEQRRIEIDAERRASRIRAAMRTMPTKTIMLCRLCGGDGYSIRGFSPSGRVLFATCGACRGIGWHPAPPDTAHTLQVCTT